MITAAGYRFNDGSPVTRQLMDEQDVVLGADVWLGARAIVLPGVRIRRRRDRGGGRSRHQDGRPRRYRRRAAREASWTSSVGLPGDDLILNSVIATHKWDSRLALAAISIGSANGDRF